MRTGMESSISDVLIGSFGNLKSDPSLKVSTFCIGVIILPA